MFDVTSSKLLILGVVALLVVGPKDLPALLRTVGRYMGIIKRHAAEFRAQFDEAMREAELEQLKKEVEGLGSTAEAQMRAAEQSLQAELGDPVATAAPRQGAEEGAAPEPGVAAAGEPALPGAVVAAAADAGQGAPGDDAPVHAKPDEGASVAAARAPEKSGA